MMQIFYSEDALCTTDNGTFHQNNVVPTLVTAIKLQSHAQGIVSVKSLLLRDISLHVYQRIASSSCEPCMGWNGPKISLGQIIDKTSFPMAQ